MRRSPRRWSFGICLTGSSEDQRTEHTVFAVSELSLVNFQEACGDTPAESPVPRRTESGDVHKTTEFRNPAVALARLTDG